MTTCKLGCCRKIMRGSPQGLTEAAVILQDTTALKAKVDAALCARILLSKGWGSLVVPRDSADSSCSEDSWDEADKEESWASPTRPVCQTYLWWTLLAVYAALKPVCALPGLPWHSQYVLVLAQCSKKRNRLCSPVCQCMPEPTCPPVAQAPLRFPTGE